MRDFLHGVINSSVLLEFVILKVKHVVKIIETILLEIYTEPTITAKTALV